MDDPISLALIISQDKLMRVRYGIIRRARILLVIGVGDHNCVAVVEASNLDWIVDGYLVEVLWWYGWLLD